MGLSEDSIAAINALKPEARELFDRLISKTKFLEAFEHLLKAREYDREYKQEQEKHIKMSWQAKSKLKNQIAALNIPEGYICVSKFRLVAAEYSTAEIIYKNALFFMRL